MPNADFIRCSSTLANKEVGQGAFFHVHVFLGVGGVGNGPKNKLTLLSEYATPSRGGHGTGKTGTLVLTFSRQGKHREFCFDTGKIFETQGLPTV